MADDNQSPQGSIWAKKGSLVVGALGLIGTVIGIWQFIIAPVNERADRRTRFDAGYESKSSNEMSQMRSSTNMLLSVIPDDIRDTRNNSLWRDIDRKWSEHIEFIEDFYRTHAQEIRSETMQAHGSEHGETVCSNIEAVLKSHYQMVQRVGTIGGISTGSGDAPSGILGVFGPTVRIPEPSNMAGIYTHELGCGSDIELLVNPPDMRSPREIVEEQLAGLEADLSEAQRQMGVNQDAALEAELKAFYDRYFGVLTGMGLSRGEADAEARKALREVYDGNGYNFMVGDLNDYADRIRRAVEIRNTDFEVVVEKLTDRLQEKREELDTLSE